MASADNKSNSGNGRHTINVGLFIPTQCQLLDAACVDIFGSMSYEYLSKMPGLFPAPVIDLAPSVRIHYIGSVAAGERIQLTAGETILATHHYDDPEVAPGKLDIVVVPGPDPFGAQPEGAVAWLRAQGAARGVDILSVCTGIFLCAEAGLAKGRTVCGTRALQDQLRAKGYGEKALVGHKLRWVQDGNLWSSGGVTNGNDLVAAYSRATPRHFARPLVEISCDMLEVGDRAQEYGPELMTPEKLGKLVQEATAISAAAAAATAAREGTA